MRSGSFFFTKEQTVNWPEHKALLAPLLPFSWLYRSVVAARNFAYDKQLLRRTRVPAKVVSLGNLAVGGSGKTPATAFFASALFARGVRVAIVARGYGREGRGACVVSDGRSVLAAIHEAGDEPLLLAQLCPGVAVVVAESKTRAAQIAAERFQPQVILIDDGFQHRRLHRDLDFVILSAEMILQKPWLLPAGPLREPLANMRRADTIFLTELQSLDERQRERALTFCRNTTAAKIFPIDFVIDEIRPLFEGKNLAAAEARCASTVLVSGIARPERFYKTAAATGMKICEHLVFGDHHRYSTADLDYVAKKFEASGANYLLTTAKDAIKLREFTRLRGLPIYTLDIKTTMSETAINTLMHMLLR